MNERRGDKRNLRLWKLCILFGAETNLSVGFYSCKNCHLTEKHAVEYKESNVKVSQED